MRYESETHQIMLIVNALNCEATIIDYFDDNGMHYRLRDLPTDKSFVFVLEEIISPCSDEDLGPTFHKVQEVKQVAAISREMVEDLDTDDLITRATSRYCNRLTRLVTEFQDFLEFLYLH